MKKDVVIIGAGLGGLLCGYILAQHGMGVTVLEKNPLIGGCLQSFKRHGVLFDTGMHYIGSMKEGQLLNRFWKYFNLLDRVNLRPLDDAAFDVVSFKGRRYLSATGSEAYIDKLSTYFPAHHAEIKRYVETIGTVATCSPISRLEEVRGGMSLDPEYVTTSVSEFLSRLTANADLQSVWAGNLPLYAGVKGKTPFYTHAFIHNSYMQGAYRVVGGAQSIAEALCSSIVAMGGEVLCGSEVVEFLGSEAAMTGVRLKNGGVVEGRRFISAIHPQAMVGMLGESMIRRSYCRRIRHLDNTVSCFTLYMAFKKGEMPYLNSNFFHYSTDDIWSCADYTADDFPRGYMFMHQAPTDGGDFAEAAQMISYMRYEDVSKWENTSVGHRGADYEEFKQRYAEKMLAALECEFPGIRSKIDFYNVSSPLTYADYTGTCRGAMYGILRDVTSPVQTVVSQRTHIQNLFMTGQNTNSHGMLGVTNSALLTCSQLIDINTIIKSINDAYHG